MALSDSIEFAFRRRYGLTPRDPRLLDCTVEEIVLDVWAHRFADNPKLREVEVNEDFDADVAAAEAEMDLPSDGSLNEPPPDPGDFEDVVADDNFGGRS